MQLLKWYRDAALLLLGQITVRELIICSASLLMLCLSGSTALLRSMKPIMVRYIYIRGDSHWMPILYASDQNVRSPPIMKEANINCPVVLFSGLHYLWDGGSSTSLGGGNFGNIEGRKVLKASHRREQNFKFVDAGSPKGQHFWLDQLLKLSLDKNFMLF